MKRPRSARRAASSPPRSVKIRLSKLVQVGLRESPDSAVTVTRLVQKHQGSGKPVTRHRLFGMPLVITTRGKTVRVAFAMESR